MKEKKWLSAVLAVVMLLTMLLPVTALAEDPEGSLPEPDVIWWCWLQGFDQAPPIVKCCYASLEKLDRQIFIITKDKFKN